MPISLPVVSPDTSAMLECTECGKCCTYLAIEISEPTRPRNATDILWYLYHEKVSVYVDGNNEWCVQFESRCKNFADDLHCKVYRTRPHICRAFDHETCEVNCKEGEYFLFLTPAEFLAYLKQKRPRVHKMIEKQFISPELAQA